MSYILDALKKADAQRERDPARGIHAQPAVRAPAPRGDAPAPWLWAGAAVVAAVVAVAGWSLRDDHADAARPAPVAAQSAPAMPQRAAAPAAAPAPLTSPTVVAASAAPVAPPGGAPANAVLPLPEPVRATPPAAAQEDGAGPMQRRRRAGAPAQPAAAVAPQAVSAASAAPAAPGAAASVQSPAAAPAPAARTTTAAPAPAAAEPANALPPDAPKLAISGGVYSGNRTQRMLIVNGQVVNEGADLGGGVVLEEIKPKAAVLRFRGARYNVGF